MKTGSLAKVRHAFGIVMVAVTWLLALTDGAVGFLDGHYLAWVIAGCSGALALIVTACWLRDHIGEATRWATSIALAMLAAFLVLATEGTAVQVDMHMVFFAALAITAGWCCITSVALGATVVAVHHIVLNLIYPAAIFPGGANFGRVVIHAVILLSEAGALMWLAKHFADALDGSDRLAASVSAALAQQSEAEREKAELQTRLEMSRIETQELILSSVGSAVSSVKAGDFSHRSSVTPDLGRLGELVEGVNEISQTMDQATNEFAEALQALANGNLTHAVESPYMGKLAAFRNAINDTIKRLSHTVATIQQTASGITTAAQEISRGADDLSRRTEEQASALQAAAATTEQLAASVRMTATSSREAVQFAGTAREIAENGGSTISDAVAAMSRIESASTKITDIIAVINNIAFQTNLLALNAAVEAARAGDAGAGFAVVAAEVRALAQRSADAAKDISGLIGASTAEVADGVALVSKAGSTLTSIVEAFQKVTTKIEEISNATTEQALGIDEMSRSATRMDEITQQNAALAEEISASTQKLSSEMRQLDVLVAAFQTEDRPARPVRASVGHLAA